MPITVELADGREVEIDTDDPQTAARAAHAFQTRNPAPGGRAAPRPQAPPTLERRSNQNALPWQQLRQQQQRQQQRAPYTDERWVREGLPRQLIPFARDLERFNRADPAGIVTNQRRRDNAIQGVQGFGRDVAGFFNQSPGEAGGQVARGIGTGLSRIPGAVGEMVTHPLETLRGMTYGPMVDAGAANIDRARAEAVGDEGAANAAAGRANSSTVDTGINVGGLFFGGSALNSARQATSRAGLSGFVQQSARAGGTGAAIGAPIGFVRTPGDLEARTAGATTDAGVGATIGAVAPTAVNGARAGVWAGNNAPRLLGAPTVSRMAGNVWDAIPIPQNARSSVGAGGRPMARAPARPEEQPIPQEERLARMFERARVGGDALEAQGARARANPQGQLMVDLAGDTGVRTLRPVVQSPGETGALAQELVAARFDNGPRIVSERARQGLGVNETPNQATTRIEGEYARVSAESYNPIWRRPITREQSSNLQAVRDQYRGDRVYNRAERRAQEIFDRDRRNRRVTGTLEDNLPRYMHYLKMGLDIESRFQSTPQGGGAAGTQLSGIREMDVNIRRALDENVPGYLEARSEWGGLHAAEDAIEMGAEWINMMPDEVIASRRGMTQFELDHARIGLAERIRRASRGNDSGTKNAAGGILNDPDALASIEAAFDTPEQGAQFVEDTIRTQRRLMSNAAEWRAGSQTFSNASFGIDGAAHAVQAMRNPIEGAMLAAAKLLNEMGLERANDQFGRSALQRVDTAESQAFVRRMANILRQRAQARQRTEAAATAAAATATVPPADRSR
tara:strand:- start:122 stop:2512 length:2391 start_codon:yes stop_codon:yes gene_type:complete